MPHSIPSTTHKINTTIAGEQHSLFQKGRHSCSAAHGKCAWLDLCQEQAEAVLWPFLCDRAGIRQGFLRMKCPITNQELCPWERTPGSCRWHHCSLQYASPDFWMWSSPLSCMVTAQEPSPLSVNSVKLSDLRPPCLAGHLEKNKTCCSLTCKILWLISDLLTFSLSFKI